MFLSGGLDSSGVAYWLARSDAAVECFSLDFDQHDRGLAGIEREQAREVARHLSVPLTLVPVEGRDLEPVLSDLVWKLDLPFGDPVTGPQYLLGRAAREAGLNAVFNGEGGDQLFGGWTNKPMISTAIYAGLLGSGEGEDAGPGESRAESYLRSYHRFYGQEESLYTTAFRERIGPPGTRRAHLEAYLGDDSATSFLNRMRLADTALKGSQNILPRAERMANAWGLDVRVPLFDRRLGELAFSLPPQLKLHGAAEKFVLKLAMQERLPAAIVWRRKFGMGVPITDWLLGPLEGTVHELLGARARRQRGLLRGGPVERLLAGQPDPAEPRRRRIGERLWTLAMLEMWLRLFIDDRGRSRLRRGSGSPRIHDGSGAPR